MTYSTTEVTNLFYTVARGWISQDNSSVSDQFEHTRSFSSLGGDILSTIREKLDDDSFIRGQRQLIIVANEYSVMPAVKNPQKLTTQEISEIAYMATSHFFSALERAFTLEPMSFVVYVSAVCQKMESYYNAEMTEATKDRH